MKKFWKYLVIFVILISIFVGSLVLSSIFSSSKIKKNVMASSKTLNEEGNRKVCFAISKFQYMEFDNYSDSLMINTAYSIDNKTPLYSAMVARKNYLPGITEKVYEDEVGELKSDSKYDKHNEVAELEDTVNGVADESFEYAKYWHGYLTILRPLLLEFDYQQIRVLLTFVFAVLAIYITTIIAEQKSVWLSAFFLISLIFVEYFYMGLSLINSITFLIMMIASLILIMRFDKIKDFGLFFFVTGMFTGFFCLLDIPLLTLYIPLILYYIYKGGNGKGDFKELIKFSLIWLLGYFLTWMTKWVLMDIIYHKNLIRTALSQILYRSTAGGFSAIFATYLNVVMMVFPIMLTTCILSWFVAIRLRFVNSETRKKSRVFVIISIIPFIWYLLFPNHFTYRFLLISMFSMLTWGYYVFGEAKK